MAHTNSIAAPIVKAIVEVLEDIDFSAINACRYVGIDLNELNLPHGRIAEKDFYSLMTMVNNLCTRPSLGLELGKRFLPTATGIFGFSLMTAKSYQDMVQRCYENQEYLSDTLKIAITKQSDYIDIAFSTSLSNTDTDYFIHDFIISNAVKSMQWILGDNNLTPLEVLFTRPEPNNIQDYQEYFNCPLKFNEPVNSFKLDPSVATKTNPSHNDNLDNQNCYELQQVIETSSQPGIAHRVREQIKVLLPQGDITMDMVAKNYSFSERTLLRRLKEEGYTFQSLIDKTRKQASKHLLDKTSSSLQEITFLLGFKDASTFYRAFKRWYNVTPSQYRKSCAANPEYSTESDIRSGTDNIHKSNQ